MQGEVIYKGGQRMKDKETKEHTHTLITNGIGKTKKKWRNKEGKE